MSDQHIVSSFTEDMIELDSLVLQMGGLVEQQLKDATIALNKEDRELAKKVLRGDEAVNELEATLNDTAIKILALRQPVAMDLRNVVVSLKIARHLERMGDYSKNIGRRTNTLAKADAYTGSVATLIRMSEKVQAMLKSVLDAYSHRDAEKADLVRAEDQQVDLMLNSLFRELLTYMMEDPRNISGAMHFLFMAKNIERIGDHIADIAKETMYMVTGEWPQDKRNKEDKTSKMIVDISDNEAID